MSQRKDLLQCMALEINFATIITGYYIRILYRVCEMCYI